MEVEEEGDFYLKEAEEDFMNCDARSLEMRGQKVYMYSRAVEGCYVGTRGLCPNLTKPTSYILSHYSCH